MHRRSLTVSALLMVLMMISAGVVHASGGESWSKEHKKDADSTAEHHPRNKGDRTIRLIGIQELDEASRITVDGQVFTGDEPLPEDYVPSPGDVDVYRERLFRLDRSDPDNPRPRGRQLGTVLAECTTITVGEEDAPEDLSILCSRMFTLEGKGDIAAAESFTLADPESDTIPITGGTGKFRDAGGDIFFDVQPIEGTDLFNSIYTINLLHLDDGRRRR